MRPRFFFAARFFFLALLLLLSVSPSAHAQNPAVLGDGHLNFGGTEGNSGYGIRDNGGTIECKDNGGSWAPCAGGGGGLPTCSEGEGLIYTSGAWACQEQVPDLFSFTDVRNQLTSTLIISNSVNIGGITGSVAVSVSGQGSPKVRINGGSWVTSGTITNGQSLEVQLTSSSSSNTMYSATVTVGGGSNQWDVTTCAGVQVGGYCWYASGDGQDCDTACASQGGGCDLTGIKAYAGSDGSNANCQAVLAALGLGSGSVSTTGGSYGCSFAAGARYRAIAATTSHHLCG